ncbi:MAG: hypothetical protein Q9N67_03670 [Ghiorsea sp.]|nr:hypothetical protein [Ghiorsea sp.]
MGFFSSLWDGAKSVVKTIFGDHSSTEATSHTNSSVSSSQIIYEPDKVKIAELENGRMDKAIEAQKEIMHMNNEMQLYIMEAHQKVLNIAPKSSKR